jgi:hypothetical protein
MSVLWESTRRLSRHPGRFCMRVTSASRLHSLVALSIINNLSFGDTLFFEEFADGRVTLKDPQQIKEKMTAEYVFLFSDCLLETKPPVCSPSLTLRTLVLVISITSSSYFLSLRRDTHALRKASA